MPIITSLEAGGVKLASHEMGSGGVTLIEDRRRGIESVWVISCDAEDNGARVDFNLGVTSAMARKIHKEGKIVDLMAPEQSNKKHFFVDYGQTKTSDVMISDTAVARLSVQHVPEEISLAALNLN